MKLEIEHIHAYLAGLIDGEGYLGLIPSRGKDLVNKSFEPVIKIGMTGELSYQYFMHLKKYYGGTVETRKKKTKGGRIAFTYVLKSKAKVLRLLKDIHPYLIVKRDQSELLKEFCRLPMTHPKHNNYNHDSYLRKIEIYKELKQLKQPPATTE